MPRTSAERIGGAAAYGFVLLTTVVSLLYLIGGEFKPATLALLGAPLAAAILLHLRGSRFVLVHAVNALLIYLCTFILATLPIWLYRLQEHGMLLPRPAKVLGGWVDPVGFILVGACVLLGLPLVFITYEALFAAWNGSFLEQWPPLDWLRGWLMPNGGRRTSGGKAAS